MAGRIVFPTALIVLAVLAGCSRGPKVPRASQWFADKYVQINNGMTEQEVDELLRDCPSEVYHDDCKHRMADVGGRVTEVDCHHWKTYDEKPHSMEQDHFIYVFFDENGRVIGKQFGEWIS